MVALAAVAKETASNLSNGPEVYVSKRKLDADVLQAWSLRVSEMAADLASVDGDGPDVATTILEGDSRSCNTLLRPFGDRFAGVLTSPPYPAEHDYTRNFRLELAVCGFVENLDSVRSIKRRMIRSDSKSLYKDDSDGELVKNHAPIRRVVSEIERRAASKTHGFARKYPRLVAEYFGGLLRHLVALHEVTAPGAQCVLVLGDQQSFLNVRIRTADLLASLLRAEEIGFSVDDKVKVNSRWSTTRRRSLPEYALVMTRSAD